MKHEELRHCAICKQGVMHSNNPLFWRVTLERFMVDCKAVRQQVGLEMMLGNAQLAHVMGPNHDIAKPVMKSITITVCEACANQEHLLLDLAVASTQPINENAITNES